MKNVIYFLAFIFINGLFEVAYGAIELKASFEAARQNMESIKRSEAVISQNEEQKKRARAAVLPTISGIGTYTRIDPPVSAGQNPFLLTKQHSFGLRLSQPILRGGTVSAYKLAQESILLARYQKDATELNLYQLVISAYYNLALSQKDVSNVESLLKFSRERVKEIRERTLIGRSRKGELVEAQAQLHIAESQYRQTLMGLQQAEKNFEFYTNLKAGELIFEGEVPTLSGPLQDFLSGIKKRPDILAADQGTKIASEQIQIAKGSHYPQVDLTSNYYFDRTGILATSEWDVGVSVSIPLFQGGGVQASVRQAVEARRIAELQSMESERLAEREIAINYQNLLQIQEQLKSLKEALNKSEEAYRLNKKDYQFGLVTNLDVLQSMNMFIETKRSFDSLVSLAHLNFKNLEALTGVLP